MPNPPINNPSFAITLKDAGDNRHKGVGGVVFKRVLLLHLL